MPYLGLSPVTREGDDFRINNFAAGVDFTAGSSTQVTLTNSPATENAILVSMDGVTQHHNTFSLSGTTLTFSEAIPTGVTNIEVQYYIKSTLNTVASSAINANTMFADGVITNHAINSNAVTTAKIADTNVTTAKIADANITGAKLNIASVAASNGVFTHNNNEYTKSQRTSIQDLGVRSTAAGNLTVTLTLNDSNHYKWVANGNVTVANPTLTNNIGQCGSIVISANGSYTTSWGSYWRFASGTAPTLSTVAGKEDRIDYYVATSNTIHTVSTIDLLGTA